MRVIRNNKSGSDGMFIGYANANSGITRIFGGGATSGELIKYAGYTQEPGSFRAPIFYDSTNTGYYIRPADSDSGILRGWLRFNDYGAGVVGLYDSFRYQLVFAMGDAYKGNITGTSLTGAYGLWWSHPNAGGPASNLSNHGLMCIVNGAFYASLDASMRAISDMRAPIFYDYNNTGYYLDPASTTSLKTYGDWRADSGPWTGEYAGKIQYHNNSWYFQYSNNFIFRNSGGGEPFYGDTSGNTWAVASSRAPVFYDSNNTAYFGDFASTGDSIRAAGNIVAYYSDERLKKHLGKIENALDKVQQLEGFYYEANEVAQKLGYKAKREVGVSAQAVQRVLPEIVTDAPISAQYLTIDYERLVPLLVEAIKELKSELDEVKLRIH
jgi:hypothetical protein